MDLVGKASGGVNVIARPQARLPFYAATSVRPVQAEVYWHFEDEPAASARLIGVFRPGQQVTYPFNPLVDRNIILRTVGISARGVRSVRELADAPAHLLVFQRETEAPTLTQVGASTHTLITLAVSGFSALAIKRKVRTADNEAITTNVQEYETVLTPGEVLPRVIYLIRDDAGTGTRDVWVRVSHSSGGAYGAESTAQMFTWADSGGAGGGTGSGDPFGGGEYCFNGRVRIRTPLGFASLETLSQVNGDKPFWIDNHTGRHQARMVVHRNCSVIAIDMGNGEIVTPSHRMLANGDWRCANEHFPDARRVRFDGTLYNLHVLSANPADHHYCLENGETAHNVKPES